MSGEPPQVPIWENTTPPSICCSRETNIERNQSGARSFFLCAQEPARSLYRVGRFPKSLDSVNHHWLHRTMVKIGFPNHFASLVSSINHHLPPKYSSTVLNRKAYPSTEESAKETPLVCFFSFYPSNPLLQKFITTVLSKDCTHLADTL